MRDRDSGSNRLLLGLSAVEFVCGLALALLPDQSTVGRVFGGLLALAGLVQVVFYVRRLRHRAGERQSDFLD